MPETFERELEAVINRHSQENASNTPDFILAQFLLSCLAAWNAGVTRREQWYGRDTRSTGGDGPSPVASAGTHAERGDTPSTDSP